MLITNKMLLMFILMLQCSIIYAQEVEHNFEVAPKNTDCDSLDLTGRELENIIEHAFVRTRGSIISDSKLPYYVRGAGHRPAATEEVSEESDERARLQNVLRQCQWNRNKAAKTSPSGR